MRKKIKDSEYIEKFLDGAWMREISTVNKQKKVISELSKKIDKYKTKILNSNSYKKIYTKPTWKY